MSSDAEIIEAVLGGDTDRFSELVVRHQQQVWNLAYGLVGNFEDARELSQNGFVKAYLHLRGFRREAKFSTWLYRIVVNECKDFFRRAAREPDLQSLSGDAPEDEVLFDVADPAGIPSDLLETQEMARRLSAAMETLPTRQRAAFALHHLQGLSLEEAGRVMGCRVGTVKAHLFRACEALRIALEPFMKVKVCP